MRVVAKRLLAPSPRQDDPSDEVKLRGEPQLVVKLQAELEKIAASLRDRVVLAVDIPASQHRALIGRGGQNLNEIQSNTGAQVQFPGSRSYHQVGEAENTAEFAEVDPADVVKVTGSRAACKAAIDILKVSSVTACINFSISYRTGSSEIYCCGNHGQCHRAFEISPCYQPARFILSESPVLWSPGRAIGTAKQVRVAVKTTQCPCVRAY